MKVLAKQGYEMDHNFETPQSTLLTNVVTPDTEPYQCGVGWPFLDVKVAKASIHQYYQADLAHRSRSKRIAQEGASSVLAGASATTSSGLRAGEGRADEAMEQVEVPTPSGLRAGGEVENEDAHGDSDV
eukprot:6477056-Amphidinium_carterae.1